MIYMSSMNKNQPDNSDFAITGSEIKKKRWKKVTPAVLLILPLVSKGHS